MIGEPKGLAWFSVGQERGGKMEFRDLKAQYGALKAQIDLGVDEVLASSHFIGGQKVSELEGKLAEYVGAKHCVSCANGTDALQLALMAWEIGSGDAVFVPDFTFFSSGEVVSAVGAMPVFVDIELDTFNMDPRKLEDAILSVERAGKFRPRVVIAVDLFGLPADYGRIRPICERHGLLLLEDGAQGFGGMVNGRTACSLGDISTTSFFPAKPLGCYGDGGAIFTDSDEWEALLRSYAVHGKGECRYDNVRVGMNSRLDEIQAAVLLPKLKAFPTELEMVNSAADRYSALLDGLPLKLPKVPNGYRSSWAQYTIVLPEDADRGDIRRYLGDRGIPTMVYYPKPMSSQLAFAGRCCLPEKCEVTEFACNKVLSLPLSPYIDPETQVRVVDNLKMLL